MHPLSLDLKFMEKWHEDIDVVKFLTGLPPKFEAIRAQIQGEKKLPNLVETCSRIQCSTLSHSTRNEDHSTFIARGGSFRVGRSGRGGRGFTPQGG